MRLLYPDDPLDQRLPDGLFLQEAEIARARGLKVSIFSFEDFERGRFSPKPRPAPGETLLYRGWMLNLDGYARLTHAAAELEARMIVSPESYRSAHHLPSWYPLLRDFSAETLVLEEGTDFVTALRDTNWSGYFVKDYVKSLSTGTGSLVRSTEDIARVVAALKKYRGEIEGGVCVRREEAYVAGSERRYFVAAGRAFSATGEVPDAVTACQALIPSPFFSVDTAQRTDGVIRIVEIGDGQVSDRKEWPAEKLVEVLAHIGQ
jgi:hypothetical protein